MTLSARVAAAIIAIAACVGLALHFVQITRTTGSPLTAAWIMLAFFTVITDLLVGVLFVGIAVGAKSFWKSSLIAGAALSILLVGVVYALLLHGSMELTGGSAVANVLLHMVTPVLAPLFWFAFVRKGDLLRTDLIAWAIYPFVYLPYALTRGHLTAKYAYPFLDVAQLGWTRVSLNCAVIAAGFLLAGWAWIAMDRRLGRA